MENKPLRFKDIIKRKMIAPGFRGNGECESKKLFHQAQIEFDKRSNDGLIKTGFELERIAAGGLRSVIHHQRQVEAVFSRLLALGTKAPDSLVSNVHQALVVFEQGPPPDETAPRLEQGGYVTDYKGFEITYPRVRIDSSGWTVNLCSNNPHLFNKIGGRVVIIKDHVSIESAIAKAKARVDALI